MTMLFPGFEGVAAFTTQISRPDRDGDMLRYRGVRLDELVGHRPYDAVWELLVTGGARRTLLSDIGPDDLPPIGRPCGNPRVDIQRMTAALGPGWRMASLTARDPEQVAHDLRCVTMAMAVRLGQLLRRYEDAQLADVPDRDVRAGETVAQRCLIAWHGDLDEEEAKVLDGFLSTVAEHGTTASTFTARVVASTRADVSACIVAALSAIGGPRHGGAALDVVAILQDIAGGRNADELVGDLLRQGRRLPGVGHRIYKVRDPRVAALKVLADRMDAPLADVARRYESAVDSALAQRRPGRPLPMNVDSWMPVILDALGVPGAFVDSVLAASRVGGWCAHIYEEVAQDGKLLRPDDLFAETSTN
jgi:citrate synthase